MTHPKITGIIPGSSEIEEKQTSTYILNSHSLSHTVSFPFEAQGISFRTQSRNYYAQKIKSRIIIFSYKLGTVHSSTTHQGNACYTEYIV